MATSDLKKSKSGVTTREGDQLLKKLKDRFEQNLSRHQGIDWSEVEAKLLADPDNFWTLNEMEKTGGEPDLVVLELNKGKLVFYDCAKESPTQRRSLCYDNIALDSRKANKPTNSAVGLAEEMGIELLSEEDYRQLQDVVAFDEKTSSWIMTPASIRKLGGALFCDRRYDAVFTYHNGAESYYGSRGFRGKLEI